MKIVGALLAATLICTFSIAQDHDKPAAPIKIVCSIPIARITKRLEPQYPPLARQSGVRGKVVLRVVVGKDGAVKTMTVISGHPLLVQSATDAVAQWQYKPLLINEKPVEMQTIVTVIYELPKEDKKSNSR